jgi:D-glycero-D-manno-heptose 1,7-bisphosphate phosphatase
MQRMNKAVFLDRDGVLNRERGDYTWLPEDFEINEGVAEALKLFSDKGYLLIVITNQGGIARGLYTEGHVEQLNERLSQYCRERGVELTEIYYCPHHPDYGKCLCRKPGSLLLEKAIARFRIDPAQSYFVGDSERDCIAGAAAGVTTIKTEANSNLLTIAALIY